MRHGANVNAADRDLRTPLHHAAAGVSMHTPQLLKLLVRHGANVHARDMYGDNFLHVACRRNSMLSAAAALQALLAACPQPQNGIAGAAKGQTLNEKA